MIGNEEAMVEIEVMCDEQLHGLRGLFMKNAPIPYHLFHIFCKYLQLVLFH